MNQRQYTTEELWKLYEKLPNELKEAVFSQETADFVFDICERSEIEEVPRVSYFVGLVLMGVLLPGDFQKTLEEELRLKKSVAKSVAMEVNRFVFYPVKPALEQLHKMEIEVSAKVVTPQPLVEPEDQEEPKQISSKDDGYREPIE
ncbi:MAG: hypothetical protein A2842_00795 [Candidatus Wildermuthbacteria bacterium RIFCSPHIGHO2_01_FULL_48_25]|uniref:Uncharacterized protein n=1 Tax=Candidatus Wildermuthbacteria bacterium RIFCSPLOWO2_01_FULL_48_16 TaxID=1802461 RepID=A0A1G2RJS8_9BACT|nr:MAG: hypothetical protein A2842_00795 [Candidatus Wildermuthbacteria bacterium RIFCSPHIGHO2_01_FULL_48_25]OHA68212.1 MAG: hypothetical protein A3J57_01255 [Candidatus Wildermuthbacteria bacterium RIFCSPHIGHO2_02_FULL_49_12b]OHA73090.1 MAG: hypothetical protein A3B24_01605 [Candidatus Wildermuthbacteria bacterium RIFCSPLOWO2_01_FULL_48_16]